MNQDNNQFNQNSINDYSNLQPQNKKGNLLLIVGIVSIVIILIVVGLVLFGKTKSSDNHKTDNSNNILSKQFYQISGTKDKGSLAMSTNFESEKLSEYNYIEKYDMKWTVGNELYIMPVPVIPNRTYSLNGYATHIIEMKSDVIDLDYNVLSDEVNNSTVKSLLENDKNEYSSGMYTINKITDVIEKNGVNAYAYSLKTITTTQIRIWYYLNIDNSISNNNYTLSGLLTFDINDYENVKNIIDEVSKTLNFDISSLVEQVK